MKLKVGQKIRVKPDLIGGRCYDDKYFNDDMAKFNGTIVTISEIYGDGDIGLVEDDGGWRWREAMFNNILSFRKSDLQDGDRVTDREGGISIYNNGEFEGNTVEINCFNEDLLDKDGDTGYDIVKVERGNYTTIFERNEDEYAEYTIEELEQIVGHKIKIKGE